VEHRSRQSCVGHAQILPREFHKLLHGHILSESGVCGVVEGQEGLIFQHEGDGDQSEKVEGREIPGGAIKLDEGVEAVQNIRARVATFVLVGVHK
jgi:hypothetical protein